MSGGQINTLGTTEEQMLKRYIYMSSLKSSFVQNQPSHTLGLLNATLQQNDSTRPSFSVTL